jgi:hypothetical protein
MRKEIVHHKPTHLCSPFIENFNTLEFNPILKQLLKEYVSSKYEEYATYDEDSLLAEYKYLIQNNSLDELFEWEFLQNSILNFK